MRERTGKIVGPKVMRVGLRSRIQETKSKEDTKFWFEEVEMCHEKTAKILNDVLFHHLIQTEKILRG